jgi:uncharacterized membrane protein
MSRQAILLCLLCQLLILAGQLLLKRGVSKKHPSNIAGGIVLMAVWFFLWLGLMGHWDLSKLYPFEGLNPAMMAIVAWIFLKERLPASAWIGLVLVSIGVAIVAGS